MGTLNLLSVDNIGGSKGPHNTEGGRIMAIKPHTKKPPKKRNKTGVPEVKSIPETSKPFKKKPPKKKRSQANNSVEVPEAEFIGTDYSRGDQPLRRVQDENINTADGNETKVGTVKDWEDELKEKKKDDSTGPPEAEFAISLDKDTLIEGIKDNGAEESYENNRIEFASKQRDNSDETQESNSSGDIHACY